MKILLPILCLLFIAPPAWAKVVVDTKTTYYLVQGKGASAIFNDIAQKRTKTKKSEAIATTHYTISYSYSWVNHGNKCFLSDVTITMKLTYTYPRLAETQDKRTQKWWETLLADVERHELKHGAIATEALHRLDQELLTLETGPCSDLKKTVETITNRNRDKMEAEQKAFDVEEHKDGLTAAQEHP